jgi:membrane-anchored glycerophosphoryl diester phosphodiesterase (GDPDase)
MALKFVHILIIAGLILSITGGISRTKTAQDSLDAGAHELQLASVVFAVVWILMAIACLVYIKNLHYVQTAAKRVTMNHHGYLYLQTD